MRPVVLCLCFMLCIYLPRMEELVGALKQLCLCEELSDRPLRREEQSGNIKQQGLPYTPMEALDIVKEKYAANFIRQRLGEEEYCYKLPDAEYYLVYEGPGAAEDEYIIHLYEFVIGNPNENIGHTVTYGWYLFDRNTGEITEY